MKFKFCCSCKDKELWDTHKGIAGYETVKLQLNEDGTINYTCFHCNPKYGRGDHSKLEPIEIKTRNNCEHIKELLEKKEEIIVNIIKRKNKEFEIGYEYLLRCHECCSKASIEDDKYLDAILDDDIEHGCFISDPWSCEDRPEEEIDEDEENDI